MKTCFKCGTQKPLEAFYKHPAMADGRLGKCIDCTKSDVLHHRAAHLDAIQAYDRERGKLPHRIAKCKAYARTHPDVVRAIRQRWVANHPAQNADAHRRTMAKYPDRRTARVAVGNALRDGRLKKQPCETCGALNVEAHHDDYTKPLEVRWLCNGHHKAADAERRLRDAQ